jgi:hypothetical protein
MMGRTFWPIMPSKIELSGHCRNNLFAVPLLVWDERYTEELLPDRRQLQIDKLGI